jgi:hypothetical protein
MPPALTVVLTRIDITSFHKRILGSQSLTITPPALIMVLTRIGVISFRVD